jgi:hypothetical protein
MWSLWQKSGHRRQVEAKIRRGGASRVEKSWPTGTRSSRRIDWRAWEERGRPEEARRRGGRRAAVEAVRVELWRGEAGRVRFGRVQEVEGIRL